MTKRGKDFLDDLLNLPGIYGASLSPNRKNIAFNMSKVHPNIDVFNMRISQNENGIEFNPIEALTFSPEYTAFLDWFKDSRSILVAEDKDGDEKSILYRVHLDRPGEMERLTALNPPYFIRGGDVSPCGRYLYYSTNFDFENNVVLEETVVVRHDLKTGKITTLAHPIGPNYLVPQLNKAGTHLIYTRKDLDPTGTQVYMVDINGHEDRCILNFGDSAKVEAEWMPDSRRIIFETDMVDGQRLKSINVGLLDILTNEIRWLFDSRVDGRNIEGFIVPSEGNRIVLVETMNARDRGYILDVDYMNEVPISVKAGTLMPFEPFDNGLWLGGHYSSTSPGNLVLFKESAPETTRQNITDTAKMGNFNINNLTKAYDYKWNGLDQLPIHGWLYVPKNGNGKAIVYVHGGPTAHSSDSINTQIQYLTSRGYVVLDPNYRGSTGYGIDFREKIKEDGWGGLEQEDIRQGILKMQADGYAKPGKVGITGTSYGGYSSWYAITKFAPEVIKAAAPVSGMTDLIVDYHTTRPDLRPYSEEMMGGTPDQKSEKYKARSPINFIHNIKGKVLIVQGANDPNVTMDNVNEVTRELDANAIPYETLVFADEGHGVIKKENQKLLLLELDRFFSSTL